MGENINREELAKKVLSGGESKFYVGDRVELNGIVASLDAVTESSGSAYNKPADGNVFVLCTFTIENSSSFLNRSKKEFVQYLNSENYHTPMYYTIIVDNKKVYQVQLSD